MRHQQFELGNDLWFEQGRTAAAIEAYTDAFQQNPDNPVVAYQYSKALWAVDRVEESMTVIARAIEEKDDIGYYGQRMIDRLHRRLSSGRTRRSSAWPVNQLDRDNLDRLDQSTIDWRLVAWEASERDMWGLATYALDQWEGTPIDGEEARDIEKITISAAVSRQMLDDMGNEDVNSRPNEPTIDDSDQTTNLSRPAETRTSHSAPEQPSTSNPYLAESVRRQQLSSDERIQTSSSAVGLSIVIEPSHASVDVPTTASATIRNASDAPIGVNRRLLLNQPGKVGEVWLDVAGPEGYRNSKGIRIRANQCPDEFYVTLDPGASVGKTWDLNRYESLDTPGIYTLTMTYHQELPAAPESGRPLWVGEVSATATFERT